MITSLGLDQYRGFGQYRLAQLSRVNLLVGKNNCGKTSILEAVHLLASGGRPDVFSNIAWERGEVPFGEDEQDATGLRRGTDVSHLFHDHDFRVGSSFTITSDNSRGSLKVQVVTAEESNKKDTHQRQLEDPPGFVLRIEASSGSEPKSIDLSVSFDGMIFAGRHNSAFFSPVPHNAPPILSISPGSLESHSMSGMWNKVLVEKREGEVIEAMRILDPRLDSISFLSGDRGFRPGRGGVVVGFEGSQQRVPLGSHGEGMRRLLALSLSLFCAEGGILLVDEIDTGLHYSAMEEMWLLVVKAAERFDVQVFATTHSFDCVRGLAALVESHPEVKDQISVQKIDRNLDEAVAFAADEIENAIDHGIEVR